MIRRIWVRSLNRRMLAALLVIGLIAFGLLGYQESHDQFDALDFFRYFLVSISGHILTALLTLLAADWISRSRVLESEKRFLIMALGSPDNVIALEAVRVLRGRGWLENGILRHVFLTKANLQGGALWHADLQAAELIEANLHAADLHGVNFASAKLWQIDFEKAQLMNANFEAADVRQCKFDAANLWRANLSRARLEHTSLRNASLRQLDLRGAFLMRVDLRGADLTDARMIGVRFLNVQFDEQTILPDANHWSSEVDLTQYTHLPSNFQQGISSHDTM